MSKTMGDLERKMVELTYDVASSKEPVCYVDRVNPILRSTKVYVEEDQRYKKVF